MAANAEVMPKVMPKSLDPTTLDYVMMKLVETSTRASQFLAAEPGDEPEEEQVSMLLCGIKHLSNVLDLLGVELNV